MRPIKLDPTLAAGALLPHAALYLYWWDEDRGRLSLRSAHFAAPEAAVRPGYAGLVEDAGRAPVPLTLPPCESLEPVVWTRAGETWLDLPLGRRALLRFRLEPGAAAPSPRRLRALTKWAAGVRFDGR